MPDDVIAQQRADYDAEIVHREPPPEPKVEGDKSVETPPPVDEKADVQPELRQELPPVEPDQIKQVADTGEFARDIPAVDGGTVNLRWQLKENTMKGGFTAR